MILRQVFDKDRHTFSYIIGCQKTGEALIIDPVRSNGRSTTKLP